MPCKHTRDDAACFVCLQVAIRKESSLFIAVLVLVCLLALLLLLLLLLLQLLLLLLLLPLSSSLLSLWLRLLLWLRLGLCVPGRDRGCCGCCGGCSCGGCCCRCSLVHEVCLSRCSSSFTPSSICIDFFYLTHNHFYTVVVLIVTFAVVGHSLDAPSRDPECLNARGSDGHSVGT